MIRNRLYLVPVSALILAILACNLPASATLTPAPGAADTAVAQTATAVAQLTGTVGPATDTPLPATDTPVPATFLPSTNTPIPSPTQACDSAQFISETIPDGTTESAGASFTKTWRLKNIGSCTWNSSYAVVFVSGNPLNAPSSVPLTGNVAPGQQVDVAVTMQAPATPGDYTGNWTLRNASGVLFGLGAGNGLFWVKINVASPTATATSSVPVLHLPIIPILLPSTSQALAQANVQVDATGHVQVNCPSGSIVTGGGFAGSSNLLVYSSFPSGNGWEVAAQNLSTSVQLLNAYAECLSNSSGSTAPVVSQVTAAAGGIGHGVVNCPSGSVVTGGGFAGNFNLFVYSNSASGNGWEVDARNTSASGQPLNSYAVCLSGTSGSTQQLLTQVNAAASGAGHAVVNCPSATYLTGGGYAGNQDLFVFNDSAAGAGWQVYAQNTSASTQLLNSYVLCLTLP